MPIDSTNGPHPPTGGDGTHTVTCDYCQDRLSAAAAVTLDMSDPESYYPDYRHYCHGCEPAVREVA